ncbi:MAG: hypothetical protein ACRETW_16160, partial [Stenotrophobium sp.]
CEMAKSVGRPTADTAERKLTTATAVPPPAACGKSSAASDAGSVKDPRDAWTLPELLEDWQERAGIMMDSGMSQADAERDAWNLVIYKPERLH